MATVCVSWQQPSFGFGNTHPSLVHKDPPFIDCCGYVTYLEYPEYNNAVWLYDANVNYLSGKHIPLFIGAVLVFLFVFLPYTLLLLFGQWLQAISHWRLFSWVSSARLKPFMVPIMLPTRQTIATDSPGLLLVFHFVLLVFAFEFNPQRDSSINLQQFLLQQESL